MEMLPNLMKNHKKYLFLFFSTFTAFFLPLSGSAFAACGDNITGGAGTLGDPYQIDDANELNAVSNCLGSDYSGVYFQVTSNIDLDVSPYNTGSDSFIYPDKFQETQEAYLQRIGDKDEEGSLTHDGFFHKNSKDGGRLHSNWLSMMYPRLFLARNLLRQDGMIFVSIGVNGKITSLRTPLSGFLEDIPAKVGGRSAKKPKRAAQ